MCTGHESGAVTAVRESTVGRKSLKGAVLSTVPSYLPAASISSLVGVGPQCMPKLVSASALVDAAEGWFSFCFSTSYIDRVRARRRTFMKPRQRSSPVLI